MKIGLIFAGQGAQHTGMGKDLYETSEAAKKVIDIAGEEIKGWCFEGTKEMLRQTNITQPCIYTVTMAAYEAFLEEISKLTNEQKDSVEIMGMAGFSLGEYAALTAGGAIEDYEIGLNVVKQRGKWMNEAGLNENGEGKGGMIAAFGDRTKILECVKTVREDGILEGVNFNSPIQTVVAGDKEALARFRKKAKEQGDIKAVPLSVSTAFHSPMMESAVKKLKPLLLESNLKEPVFKLYSNVTGKDLMEGADKPADKWIADIMAKQAMSPVYWQEIVENIIADGAQVLVEIGPGNTLSGLVKKINHDMITMNVSDEETLKLTIKRIIDLLKKEEAGEELIEEGEK
ncbi:ACP S-malonyltransferase [Anaerovorax odorimutans]|uniref:ACP S-malonyltransferase n=1 Tax=Anaerovorax odorimutans TaxID=109327 RepID=UPI000686129B|nr:ACP S-malonyltransferase [Anaerovorax odorimutans]